MDCAPQFNLAQDAQALIATFASMEKMTIDSTLQLSNQTFAPASTLIWAKEGALGYPKCRRDNLAVIQSTALKMMDNLKTAFRTCKHEGEFLNACSMLQGIAQSYHNQAIPGLNKLGNFPSEAYLWHTSAKLAKLSTCITTFKQTIQNAIDLTQLVMADANCFFLVQSHPKIIQNTPIDDMKEELNLLPAPNAPMKKNDAPPPPPSKPMKPSKPSTAADKVKQPKNNAPTFVEEVANCKLKAVKQESKKMPQRADKLENTLAQSLLNMRTSFMDENKNSSSTSWSDD